MYLPTKFYPFVHIYFQVQRDCADLLNPHFASDGIVPRCLEHTATLDHIMDFTCLRALNSLFSMLHQMIRNIISYNQSHPDFPMLSDQIKAYVPRYLIFCLIGCFFGDGKMVYREKMVNFIRPPYHYHLVLHQSLILKLIFKENGYYGLTGNVTS